MMSGWARELEIDGESQAIIEAAKEEERNDIVTAMNKIAFELLHAEDSDAIDGYVSAVIYDLAEAIKRKFKPIGAAPVCEVCGAE